MTTQRGGSSQAARDRAYAAFADDSRSLVRGCAVLLVGDVERAERLSATVLARRHPALDRADRPATGDAMLTAALQELVRPRPGYFDPPWSGSDRVQLLDAGPRVAAPPLLVELQRLTPEQRGTLVLGQYAGLDSARVAAVLATDGPTVEMWVHQAYAALAADRAERWQPGRLAEELRAAVAASDLPPVADAAGDLAHARLLLGRRRTRTALAGLAAVVVLVLGVVTVVRGLDPAPVASEAPSPVSAPTAFSSPTVDHPGTITALCDVKVPSCQATVMREWRARMSMITVEHVDPNGTYFTGYNFSYDPRYETPSFWAGGDGALGLEVYRLRGGATEVYLQIATGYPHAVRCGRTTRQQCESQRFMDGNRFTLSTGTSLTSGIEVQYRPDGDQVITVVARNTMRGRSLDITRGDLIDLVQDPRLRLPVI